MSDQAEFAKKSFETTVKNASEVGEVIRKGLDMYEAEV